MNFEYGEMWVETTEDTDFKSPEELAREGIDDAQEYLGKLVVGMGEVINLYRSGKLGQANKIYTECIIGLDWFISLISHIESLFKVDYASIFDSEWESFNYREAFPRLFKEIIFCQRKGDWTGMADILEYEMTPLIEGWGKFLPKIKELEFSDQQIQ